MLQLKAKKFTFFVITALAFPVLLVLVYNIYIDPFQILHKDFQQPITILGGRGTDRYQQAGVINQYDIQSAIIGHSHSANYLPSKIKKEYGWEHVYSLTMDGTSLFEQSLVAGHLLEERSIKNLQWGFPILSFKAPANSTNAKLPLPRYLYDESRFNDLSFFLTLDLQKYDRRKRKRRKYILESENPLEMQNREFDYATAWYWRPQNICSFNRPGFVADKILGATRWDYGKGGAALLKSLPGKIFLEKVDAESSEGKKYQENFQNNLLPLIVAYSGTMFNFVITPRPTLWLQKLKKENLKSYIKYLKTLKQFVADTERFSNVKIFSFNLEGFTDDLRLYKDTSHFHIEVNNYLVEEMARDKGLLTVDNIDDYLRQLDKKITNYRLPEKWLPDYKQRADTGYLSFPAARLLITSRTEIPDEQITALSLKDSELPKCAKTIQQDRVQ